jgi:hypothetical protein
MEKQLENKVLTFLKSDLRRDFTIPDIMRATHITNRERVISTLVRLEERNIVEISKIVGNRIKYFRLKTVK